MGRTKKNASAGSPGISKQYRGPGIYRKAEQRGFFMAPPILLDVAFFYRHRFGGISDFFAQGLRNPISRPCVFPFRNDGLFHFFPHPYFLSSTQNECLKNLAASCEECSAVGRNSRGMHSLLRFNSGSIKLFCYGPIPATTARISPEAAAENPVWQCSLHAVFPRETSARHLQ